MGRRSSQRIKDSIDTLVETVPNPSEGLPEAIFYYIPHNLIHVHEIYRRYIETSD